VEFNKELAWESKLVVVLVAVLVPGPAVTVKRTVVVSLMRDVLATGITTTLTLRITFITTVSLCTAVLVALGGFATKAVPICVAQTTEEPAGTTVKASTLRASNARIYLGVAMIGNRQ
jgi:hypothetical protein